MRKISKKTRETIMKSVHSVILGLLGLFMIYPFIYCVLGALTTKEQFLNSVIIPKPIPFHLEQLQNFLLLFRAEGGMALYHINHRKDCFHGFYLCDYCHRRRICFFANAV